MTDRTQPPIRAPPIWKGHEDDHSNSRPIVGTSRRHLEEKENQMAKTHRRDVSDIPDRRAFFILRRLPTVKEQQLKISRFNCCFFFENLILPID